MKKVFSLLLVVAMLVSLSLVASAAGNEAGGMHTVITEGETDVTVEVYLNNIDYCGGFNLLLLSDKVTYDVDSAVLGDDFAVGKLTAADVAPSGTRPAHIKMVHTFTDLSQYVTADSVLALTFKAEKLDPNATLTAADFAYGTSALTVSKVVTGTGGTVAGLAAGNNFTSAKQPAYFTMDFVPYVPVDENPFSATVAGTTITCAGKVEATATNYGVVFTADSTVEGARAQKYYGAMPGDTVKDYEGSTTFTFGDWDGSFEIILEGVHAGEKELDFFVNDEVIADTNFVLNVQ